MNQWMVEAKGLKKYYRLGEHIVKALDGVDFTVKEQEFVAIVGKSGSGKSTFLHMLGGLDTPTEGSVCIDGRNLAGMNKEQLTVFRRRKVGFVFQNYNLVQDLNVYENIVLPIELDAPGGQKIYGRDVGSSQASGKERSTSEQSVRRPAAKSRHCAGACIKTADSSCR